MDLASATAQRLERLRDTLAARARREIAAGSSWLRAGVLVPLVPGEKGIDLLFTRRTDTVLTHKGQISFPGGQQQGPDERVRETALRETFEEIGLDPRRIDVLGELDDVLTAVSGFVVTPVVGVVADGLANLALAPDEVRDLLVVPLDRFLDPSLHTTQIRVVDGGPHQIHFYTVGDDVIWGATGQMVYQLMQVWSDG